MFHPLAVVGRLRADIPSHDDAGVDPETEPSSTVLGHDVELFAVDLVNAVSADLHFFTGRTWMALMMSSTSSPG